MATDDQAPDTVKHQFQAPADAAGQRFDALVAAFFNTYSRSRLQDWIKRGYITVDGQQRKPSDKLIGAEVIELVLPPDALAESWIDGSESGLSGIVAETMHLDLVQTDDHLFVVNKPAGLVMHPAPGNRSGTLMNGLLSADETLRSVPRAGIVHRLDKDTSGLCVVARTLQAHTNLVAQLQNRSVSRTYLAVALGDVAESGTIEEPIGRHPKDRRRMAVVHNGKYARTHYHVLERFAHCALVAVKLETGRTHQIRVHMTHIGHPLLGDPVYGKRSTSRPLWVQNHPVLSQFSRQALHAHELGLKHPHTGLQVQFEIPPPADFNQVVDALRSAQGT